MPAPHFLPATAPAATGADLFGPLAGGERGLWQGRCAVAEYGFEETASLPRWALPETTEVLVTDRRLMFAHTRAGSLDGREVTSGELRWLWPQHLRVQPGARTAGRAAATAQIQLVCAASDGSFPALVFAGGELGTVGDVDRLANLLRHSIARFRIDNAAKLGLTTPQARMLSRLLIGPEFSNYQGGEGQTVNLLGALAVHRPAVPAPPAEPPHADPPRVDHAHPGYAYSDHGHADHTHADHAHADHTQPGYAYSDGAQPGYAHADHGHADHAHADHVHADHAYADHAQPGYVHSDHGHSSYAHAEAPEAESLLLASLHGDLPPAQPAGPQHPAAEGPQPAAVNGATTRLIGYRPGLAADEARALQAAAAEQNTHLTQPDLASRAASLAARVASLVAAAEEAAEAQAAEEHAAAIRAAAEQAADTADLPTTDLTARAERVRRAAARFAANSARGKAEVRRPEHDLGSPTRGNRTF